MIEKEIYQKRFSDRQERNNLWKILVEGFFQKFIDKKDTVLDLPSGYGEFSNLIKCKEKIAIDINPDSKKYLDTGVKFYLASSTKLPLKDSSVNKVFISNFFEHLTKDDIALTLKELNRVVKKNGEVLVLQPNIRFVGSDYWMFFDHITPIHDKALEEIFLIYGFSLKKKILKFLPFTTQSRFPQASFLVKIYLNLPFLWPIFGKQTFFIFKNA